jgi:hypothetical protein
VNTTMRRNNSGTMRRNFPGTLQILAVILVAQLVLVAILYWPRPAPAGASGASLLGVKSDEVTSLTVTDNQGNHVKLAKSGAQWVLPEAGDYPADASKITPVLAQLVEMKANRLVAETPASQARLQVADDAFARRIDIETPSGMKTVYVGTSGGAGSSHVRLGGQNQVYLVSGVADWQIGADPLSWTNSAYFTVPQSDVVAMTLTNANGQLAFAKGADGQWTLQGLAADETVAPESIQRLLSAASSVTLVRPLGKTEDPAFGLGQPSAVVTLVARTDTEDKAYTLTVGSQDPNDQTYVVKSSESPYFVRAAGAVVGDLVSDKRESFLSVPPTAVPAASPATPTAAP